MISSCAIVFFYFNMSLSELPAFAPVRCPDSCQSAFAALPHLLREKMRFLCIDRWKPYLFSPVFRLSLSKNRHCFRRPRLAFTA